MDSLFDSDTLPVEGLVFRCYQGEQDLPAMLEVFQSSRIAGEELDHDETALESLADITNKFRHLTNCDPYQDVLIAEVNQQMAGYGRVNWRQLEARGEAQEGDRLYSMEWYIRPEWHGKGLDKAFLRQSQQRLRQISQQQDNEAEFHGARLFEASASSLQPELISLLEKDGFRAARWGCKMTCPDLQNIPDAPLPEGMDVRRVEASQYRQIWDALLDGFHDDPGYSEPGEAEYESWLHSAQFQPELWQVAWEGDQVTGMVLNYITRNPANAAQPATAWTEDICVRRAWRRRGLARALLARSMRMFQALGFTQTSLGVDLNNADGAHLLYQSMGYQITRRFTVYRKPLNL